MAETLNDNVSGIHKALAIFYTIVGLVVFFTVILPDPADAGILWIIPFLPVLHGIAAVGCAKGAEWGRHVSAGIGALMLLGFPIGTLVGVCILFLTLGKDWQDANTVETARDDKIAQ